MVGISAGAGAGYALSPVVDVIVAVNYRQVLTEYTSTDTYEPRVITLNPGLGIKIGKDRTAND